MELQLGFNSSKLAHLSPWKECSDLGVRISKAEAGFVVGLMVCVNYTYELDNSVIAGQKETHLCPSCR